MILDKVDGVYGANEAKMRFVIALNKESTPF
jgi:hypothetical protein